MNVTIGIPSRGRPFHLASLLLNILADWELLSHTIKQIIVVDDNDFPIVENQYICDIQAIASKLNAPIHFTPPQGGIGQTAGHQKVLEMAQTNWILRLNDDLWFPAEMLDHFLGDFFSRRRRNFIGAGWMFKFPHPQQDGYMPNLTRDLVDIELEFIEKPGYGTSKLSVINGLDFQNNRIICQQNGRIISGEKDISVCGEFLYGAGFLYNAAWAIQVGGYQPEKFESCRALHEEVHLCYRMHKASGRYFYINRDAWCFDMNPPSNVDTDGYSRRPYEQDEAQREKIKKHEEKMWALWRQIRSA